MWRWHQQSIVIEIYWSLNLFHDLSKHMILTKEPELCSSQTGSVPETKHKCLASFVILFKSMFRSPNHTVSEFGYILVNVFIEFLIISRARFTYIYGPNQIGYNMGRLPTHPLTLSAAQFRKCRLCRPDHPSSNSSSIISHLPVAFTCSRLFLVMKDSKGL